MRTSASTYYTTLSLYRGALSMDATETSDRVTLSVWVLHGAYDSHIILHWQCRA
jgi:hypothetical protein